MKAILLVLLLSPPVAFAKLKVATTTEDLAAVVRQVGGEDVEVFALARGTQDPHQLEAKPSFMVKLRDADLIVAHGVDLEAAWLVPLRQGARNPKIAGPAGLLELAASLQPIEVPPGPVSRREGDVHPGGNPHFQLDPIRLGQAALLIAKKMSEQEPARKDTFMKNAENWQSQMNAKEAQWKKRLQKTGIKEIVTYHKTFSYFCDRFEIQCTVHLEPKPGIPPTAGHLLSVAQQMRERKVRLILVENFFDLAAAEKIKQEVPDIRIARVAVYVGGEPEIKTNEQLIERIVEVFEGK